MFLEGTETTGCRGRDKCQTVLKWNLESLRALSWARFYSCYINDLPQHVASEVRLFADDCLLYRTVRTPEDHHALQRDLEHLHAWSLTWGMSVNATKCYVMAITNKKRPSSFLYSLGRCVLSKVPSTTYLGVTLREDLQWESHITGITAKANRTLGFLRRNLCYCPKQLRELAYYRLIRSLLEYASIVWDPYLA